MHPQTSQGFGFTGASTHPANKAVSLFRSHPYAVTSIATGAALALTALVNYRLAKKAERDNPPIGRFVELDGVRLHFVERGEGEPLVLLHGNGSMLEDFESSGLIDMAAAEYRVIAFDRPGHGHSERPRTTDLDTRNAGGSHKGGAGTHARSKGHCFGAFIRVRCGDSACFEVPRMR